MGEKVEINGQPLSKFGIFLGEGSYKSVLQYSQIKPININSWAEYDYTEPDLSNLVLDKRNVTLFFHAKGLEGYEDFLEYLLTHSSNEWAFLELGVTLKLRVTNNSLKSVNRYWQSFSVDFVDDLPFNKDVPATDNTELGGGGFIIDDYPFDFWGIWVLKGTLEKFRNLPKVKERLLINENSRNGSIYDINGAVKVDSNEMSIKCIIRAQSMPECVNNYYSFLNYIKRPESRKITIKATMEVVECYYSKSTCENAHVRMISGLAGIIFTVVFVIIDKGVLKTLSPDEGNFILTDSQGNYLVG